MNALNMGERLFLNFESIAPAVQLLLPKIIVYAAAVVRTFCFLSGLTFLRANLRALPLLLLALALASIVALNQDTAASEIGGRLLRPGAGGGWLTAAALASEAAAGFLFSVPLSLAAHQIVIALRLVDLLRGAQEAEQTIPGLSERVSVLERCGWVLLCALLFCSGGYRVVISFWLESFQLVPAAFLLKGGVNLTLPALIGCLERFSFVALDAVVGAVIYSTPLLAGSLVFDLARLAGGRLLGGPNFASELQGLKLVLLLFFGAVLVGFYGGEKVEPSLQRSCSALTPVRRADSVSDRQQSFSASIPCRTVFNWPGFYRTGCCRTGVWAAGFQVSAFTVSAFSTEFTGWPANSPHPAARWRTIL